MVEGGRRMVKYEDALAIAKSVKTHSITKCTEYTDAYVFAETFPEGVIHVGGNHSPVVVLKETGQPISMPAYVIGYGGILDEKFIKEIKL